MSWNTLAPKHRAELERRLTRKQLDVLVLHLGGCGSRRIADMLGISRTTAKDQIRICKNTMKELERRDAA